MTRRNLRYGDMYKDIKSMSQTLEAVRAYLTRTPASAIVNRDIINDITTTINERITP